MADGEGEGLICKRCEGQVPASDFRKNRKICKRCRTELRAESRFRAMGFMHDKVLSGLKKYGPMRAFSLAEKLDMNQASCAQICADMTKRGLIKRLLIIGKASIYAAPGYEDGPAPEEQSPNAAVGTCLVHHDQHETYVQPGITKADLDYQAYYRLPRHARRALPPPAPAVGGAAEMQSFRFAFGNDYTVKTAGNGPW